MKISACYIVKNEAENLPKSLAAIDGQVDEIIVIDTGSTDGTKAIAEKFGAKIHDFKWEGDFAAARNTAIDLATGDWILFLDADEYFTPETSGNVRRVFESFPDREALAMRIVNIDVDDDGEPKQIDNCFMVRAFRKLPNIRYRRRIHEYLFKDGPPMRLGAVDGKMLEVYHTGYTPSRSPLKAKRNLELLLEELKTTSEPETLYRYLAESYDGLGDRANAIKYAKLDIADGPRSVTYASRCYRMLLLRLPAGAERDRVLAQAVRDFPGIPEFHAEFAERKAADFDFTTAKKEMQLAIKTYREHTEDGEGMQFNDEMLKTAEERLDLFKAIEAKRRELSICACCIAKNEAAELPAWLTSAAKFADYILVLDTGSTDDTVDIAQKAATAVYRFKWQDDFAAARNFLLDKIDERFKNNSHLYIAFLDVDETFFAPEKLRGVLAKMEVTNPNGEALLLPLINVDADASDLEISRADILRVWRHNPHYRYEGHIHEALYDRGKPLTQIVRAAEPTIRHTGYSSRRVRAKLERNLAMLQNQAAAGQTTPLHNRYLADCYYGLKQYDLAIKYAQAAINDNVNTLSGSVDLYQLWLNALKAVKATEAEQLSVIEAGLARCPNSSVLMAAKGTLELSMGQKEAAKKTLTDFYRLYTAEGGGDASQTVVSALIALARLKTDKNQTYLEEALAKNPFAPEALALKVDAWTKNTEALADELLKLYPNATQGLDFLTKWAEKTGRIGLYRVLAARQGTLGEDIYELAAQGDLEEIGQKVLIGLGQNVSGLFRALLGLDDDWRRQFPDRVSGWKSMLPSSLQQILARYWGKREKLAEDEWDNFLLGLQESLHGGLEMRYAPLALDFPPDKVLAAADILWDNCKWSTAFELYSTIPTEAIKEPGKFWYRVGVNLYNLRQREAAAECLAKARENGYTPRELASYEHWLNLGNR